jgi:hypothetical protein
MAKSDDPSRAAVSAAEQSAAAPLSDAERHCLRHAGHIIVRGTAGKPLTAIIVGGDAGGIVLRDNIANVDAAKSLFSGYDIRLEVS